MLYKMFKVLSDNDHESNEQNSSPKYKQYPKDKTDKLMGSA